MEYKVLNGRNLNQLTGLAPGRLLEQLKEQSVRAIAAVDKEPVALLLYRRGGSEESAELLWIYVKGEYRSLGVGDGLMKAFFDGLSKDGIREVEGRIPENETADALQLFLNSYGFRFDHTLSYELYRNLGELGESGILLGSRPQPGCVAAAAVKEKDILDFLGSLEDKEVRERLKKGFDRIEWEISSVLTGSKGIEGLFLVLRHEDGLLEPFLLELQRPGDSNRLKLVKNSYSLAHSACGAGQELFLSCRSPESARLLDLLFPDLGPLKVRRGILRIKPLQTM
ncbi:MAG: GNAT family N-acetyltransferase [Lachnospiraceae bacterium]|nr:GNAT family N-acetyltransferase [Lachnospiraceae bacterium]